MRKFISLVVLFSSLSALAGMDEAAMKAMEPKTGEVDSSRSCFKALETLGCGHPRIDLDQFKSCMENVYTSLTPTCQNMMTDLYRRKN